MTHRILLAGPDDAPLFDEVDEDVFDGPIRPDLLQSYLADPRLHILCAMDGARMVGMCTGMHYHHPDKPPQIWVNELGVATPWRRQGLATRLVAGLADHARILACTEIWVVADPTPEAEGFWSSLGWPRTGTRLAMFATSLR